MMAGWAQARKPVPLDMHFAKRVFCLINAKINQRITGEPKAAAAPQIKININKTVYC
jgi:hypothetical protein